MGNQPQSQTVVVRSNEINNHTTRNKPETNKASLKVACMYNKDVPEEITISEFGLAICKYVYSHGLSRWIDDTPITLEECVGAAIWYADRKSNTVFVKRLIEERVNVAFHLSMWHISNMSSSIKTIYNFDTEYEYIQDKQLMFNKMENKWYAVVPGSDVGYNITICLIDRNVKLSTNSFGFRKSSVTLQQVVFES